MGVKGAPLMADCEATGRSPLVHVRLKVVLSEASMEPSSTPPIYALANAHFLLAGPLLGLVGVALLRMRGARGWRSAAWAILAKTVSNLVLVFPLSVAFAGVLPTLLGDHPLARLPWLGLAFVVALLVLSTLLEWPFFHRAWRPRGGKAALTLSLRANAVCLLLLVAVYLPFCELSLLKARALGSAPSDPKLQVFYLRGGVLLQRSLGGPETLVMNGLKADAEARLFAQRGEQGWDLWLQARQGAPRLLRAGIAPHSAQAPSQPALHIKLKTSVRTAEPALAEAWGKPAELVPEAVSPWAIQLGQWPWDGLRVDSRDLRGGYRLALDTPFLSWEPRSATHLPGERLLFQMGPYLWLLELDSRKLHLFAQGQGAQVVGL